MYAIEINNIGEVIVRDKHMNITTYPTIDHAPDVIHEKICMLKLLEVGKSHHSLGARVDESSFLIFD